MKKEKLLKILNQFYAPYPVTGHNACADKILAEMEKTAALPALTDRELNILAYEQFVQKQKTEAK